MALFRALFFLALAAGELYAFGAIALMSNAVQRNAMLMGTGACFSQPGMKYYPILGRDINGLLCSLNMLFTAGAHGPRPVQLQMATFGALFLSTVVISTYESFRSVHRRSNFIAGTLARASSIFLLIGQRFTAGFTVPLHLVFVTWSAASGLANTMARRNTADERLKALIPEPKYVWTTLFSLAGYFVPTIYLKHQDFDYLSLSLWQAFPLYILVLQIVLPPILSVLPNTRLVVTGLLTSACVAVSLLTHIELLRETVFGEFDLRDVFLLRPQTDTTSLAHGAHLVFMIDFIAVLVVCIASVLTGYGAGVSHLLANLAPFMLLAAVAGPGAAVIVFWAVREITLQRSYARSVKDSKAQ